MATADHIRNVAPQHLAPERPRIKRLLRRLVLVGMCPGECGGKIAAADQIIQFRVDVIVILIAESGTNPPSQQSVWRIRLVGQRVVAQIDVGLGKWQRFAQSVAEERRGHVIRERRRGSLAVAFVREEEKCFIAQDPASGTWYLQGTYD